MDGIENIIKALPQLSALGTTGLVVFALILVGYIVYKVVDYLKNKPAPGQDTADNSIELGKKTDKENPLANDSLKKDQNAIKDLLD